LQLPAEDQMMATRSELLDKIRGLLGGYAAEQLVFDEPSTGAGNDLERATTLARQMVCLYGMGEAAGLMHCAHEGVVTRIGMEGLLQRDCSEETAREIDKEVKQILAAAMDDAAAILEKDRTALDRIATALLERETLDGATFRQLVEAPAN
jgi:cell division protease FtsH